jgi:molybdate transport system ATP-binding protein
VLNNLNWRVKPGEKWVVSGNNGSGKSTLLSLIYADHPQAYANRISLFGRRRGHGESIWDIKRRIGFTSPELHAFFDSNLTAQEVLLSGLNDTFRPPKTVTTSQLDLLQALLRFSGLEADASRPFRQFSTGEQRMLLLLRALIKAPPVLLLDEPFQGFDAKTIERCRRLLDAVLTPEQTLIFISHFRTEVPEGIKLALAL